ncbi:hypothetical protein [Paraburkholderia hayleyella]|uniref:hypothetical protein n=1 Tax=Paraburkholderia hayleyella TaxID=2152889 RepID=UPI001292A88B|nr:hypothetical protein [Paraburkholderia hayleyella]
MQTSSATSSRIDRNLSINTDQNNETTSSNIGGKICTIDSVDTGSTTAKSQSSFTDQIKIENRSVTLASPQTETQDKVDNPGKVPHNFSDNISKEQNITTEKFNFLKRVDEERLAHVKILKLAAQKLSSENFIKNNSDYESNRLSPLIRAIQILLSKSENISEESFSTDLANFSFMNSLPPESIPLLNSHISKIEEFNKDANSLIYETLLGAPVGSMGRPTIPTQKRNEKLDAYKKNLEQMKNCKKFLEGTVRVLSGVLSTKSDLTDNQKDGNNKVINMASTLLKHSDNINEKYKIESFDKNFPEFLSGEPLSPDFYQILDNLMADMGKFIIRASSLMNSLMSDKPVYFVDYS